MVVQQSPFGRVLLVAPIAVLRQSSHIADGLGERSVRHARSALFGGPCDFAGYGQLSAGMVFENVPFSLAVAFIHFVAVCAIVETLRFKDGQIKFGHGVHRYGGVHFDQVINQHSASLETQATGVAFIDESLVVDGLRVAGIGIVGEIGRVWLNMIEIRLIGKLKWVRFWIGWVIRGELNWGQLCLVYHSIRAVGLEVRAGIYVVVFYCMIISNTFAI